MDKTINNNKNILYHLIYIILIFTLVYLFGLGMGLELNILSQISLIIIISGLVKFILFNPLILYVLLTLGFLILYLVHRYITPVLFILWERSIYLFENILYNFQGHENIAADNLLLFWSILVILVSIFTAIIIFKNKRIFILPPIYILIMLIYWYNFFDVAYWMVGIFLMSFLVLLGLEKYTSFDFQTLYKPWVKTLITYSFIILFIALIIPKSNNYIRWSWLETKIYNSFPIIADLRSNEVKGISDGGPLFSFSFSDYQDNPSKLGGPINLNDELIMTLEGKSTSNYLRGNVKQTYTGTLWKTIIEPSEEFQMKEDFSNMSVNDKRIYTSKKEITIRNHNFASNTIFSPYKAAVLDFNSDDTFIVNRDHSIFFPRGIYENESYSIEVQAPLPYGILLTLGIDNRKEDIFDLETYLQIPENTISEQVKELTKEIVKNSHTDFEKAVAIETYLRENYEYSLDVDPVPDGSEFIDYFLFEELKGYCTYYASTMAIMLRLEGIPSRYIEGFIANNLSEDGVYEIRHENAHSWVEGFIEPVGWITFEATPAYAVETRLENYKPNILPEEVIDEGAIGMDQDLGSETDGDLDSSDEDIVEDIEEGSSGEAVDINPTTINRRSIYIVLTIILSIIPIRFLFFFIKSRWVEIKSKKLSNKERVVYLYDQILTLTGFFSYKQNPGETHYEYAERVANRFHYQNRKNIKEITDIFVRSKYSNYSSSHEDVKDLLEFRDSLNQHLRRYWGLRVYYYRIYIKPNEIDPSP